MMKKLMVTLMAAAFSLAAYQQTAPPPTPAAPKGPQAKSKAEVEALVAIQNAPDHDARIAAVENLLTKFADTEFKSMALLTAADAAQQKNDYPKAVVYGERALEAESKNFSALLFLAKLLAQNTREHDLDRDEKLSKAEKYARTAMEVLKDVPKIRPDFTDEQWEAIKKDNVSQAHEALGMMAMVRKKHDEAIAEFKLAVEGTPNPDPTSLCRLGAAYNKAGKYDEAIAVLDKVAAMPDAMPVVKQFAAQERADALKAKSAKKQ